MFKPSQQRPTQQGTADAPVISPPLRMRATVQASQSFLDAMRQTGVTAEAIAGNITNFHSGIVQRFVDATRQNRDISGMMQQRRGLHVPGLDVNYRSNYGAETLEYTVYPEDHFESSGSARRTDLLSAGYVYLTIFPAKPVPVPTETYWIEIGGIKHQVDRVAVGPPAHDSGIGWTPFNPDVGLFDPDAWVKGVTDPQRVELIDPAVTSVTHSTPLTWRAPDLSTYAGGWEIPAIPIPDHTATANIFNNGKLIASVAAPITDVTTYTTLVLAFGKDALHYQGPDDDNQPDKKAILREIIPPPPLLFGYPFLRFDPFHPVRMDYIIAVPSNLWDTAGSNLFTVEWSEETVGDWTFKGQFYDRRKFDKVIQSPHDGPATDGALITCNDRIVTWTENHFSVDTPVLINFKNPDETAGGPIV